MRLPISVDAKLAPTTVSMTLPLAMDTPLEAVVMPSPVAPYALTLVYSVATHAGTPPLVAVRDCPVAPIPSLCAAPLEPPTIRSPFVRPVKLMAFSTSEAGNMLGLAADWLSEPIKNALVLKVVSGVAVLKSIIIARRGLSGSADRGMRALSYVDALDRSRALLGQIEGAALARIAAARGAVSPSEPERGLRNGRKSGAENLGSRLSPPRKNPRPSGRGRR